MGNGPISSGTQAAERQRLALQLAQASAAEAGTGPTDTIAAGCGLIRAGVFFDGTGNSKDHVPVNGTAWHTNIDLLSRQYRTVVGEIIELNGQPREVLYFPRYMRGIGVDDDGTVDDIISVEDIASFRDGFLPGPRGLGWGTGAEGVEARVAQAFRALEEEFRIRAPGLQPCDIWLDVFGFSRGATAARDFANGVLDQEIRFGSSNIKVKFMGLFDTVSSVGEGGNPGNYGNVNLNTNRIIAEEIVHITAEDEIRENFPLTLAWNSKRIRMVGSHSDVGGGYMPETEKNNGVYELSKRDDETDYSSVLKFLLDKWGFDSEPHDSLPGMDTYLNDEGDSIIVKYFSRSRVPENFLISIGAEHGLQFVALRLMYDQAIAAGVPFAKELGDSIGGISIALTDDLKSYYDYLKNNASEPREDLERSIRQKYTHVSLSKAPVAKVIYPHMPVAEGERKVVSL